QADVHLPRIVGQPAEGAHQVRGEHQRDDQQAVADVQQVASLGALQQRQGGELSDRPFGVNEAAHRSPCYPFDARGLTMVNTTRCSRLPARTNAAAMSAMPMITGKSRSCAACHAMRPIPGQLNTCSTITAPPSRNGILALISSVTGMRKPSLNAWRHTGAPLARAVRM